jgi:hypothetical protein
MRFFTSEYMGVYRSESYISHSRFDAFTDYAAFSVDYYSAACVGSALVFFDKEGWTAWQDSALLEKKWKEKWEESCTDSYFWSVSEDYNEVEKCAGPDDGAQTSVVIFAEPTISSSLSYSWASQEHSLTKKHHTSVPELSLSDNPNSSRCSDDGIYHHSTSRHHCSVNYDENDTSFRGKYC